MMEEAEESLNDFMQCCSGTSPSAASASMSILRANRLDLSNFDGPQVRGQFRHLPPSPDPAKRIGIPPIHPYFSPSPYQRISTAAAAAVRSSSSSQLFTSVPTHSRSLSQPAFFNLDSLPQFTSHSPPFADSSPAASDPSSSADVEMDDRGVTVASSHGTPPPVPLARTNSSGGSGRATGDGLPPRKAHRRSQSDIPFGFLQSFAAAALPPLPHQASGFPSHLVSPRTSNQFVKQEGEWGREGDGSAERKSGSDGYVGDDLFSAYMNLESLDTLNSSGTEEKREDSRASGTKTNGADSSENEAESSVNESGSSLQLRGISLERKEGNKRSAAGDPAPINLSASLHNRSISMDSFMGKLQFGEESLKLPPSPGLQPHSPTGSLDGMTNTFSLEFGNGAFSGTELKKIMANEKLAEIATADPKRAKRILANRQSAARSKERKMRYISELEHKVQTLQTEATTLSAQLTLLQRDSAGLTSQNNELKFRLQAMEQQTQLRDALNEALTAEVQHLKLAAGEAQLANSLNQQMQLNPQMFSLQKPLQKQQQQSSQVSHYLMQPQQQPEQQQQRQQQQKNKDFSKHDSSK